MKARKVIFIFISVIIAGSSFAQNNSIIADPRLSSCFDSTYIMQMQNTNPALLAYYNFYLDNSFYTTSLTQPKPITGEDIKKVTVNEDIAKGKTIYFAEKTYDANTFNVLKYNFKTQDSNFTTYLWKDANIAVVFLPREKIAAAFKEYCTNNSIKSK